MIFEFGVRKRFRFFSRRSVCPTRVFRHKRPHLRVEVRSFFSRRSNYRFRVFIDTRCIRSQQSFNHKAAPSWKRPSHRQRSSMISRFCVRKRLKILPFNGLLSKTFSIVFCFFSLVFKNVSVKSITFGFRLCQRFEVTRFQQFSGLVSVNVFTLFTLTGLVSKKVFEFSFKCFVTKNVYYLNCSTLSYMLYCI